jgi:hypothetical protein
VLEWDELVLNHLQVFQERLDRGEHFAGQVLQAQRGLFPAQERGQPPFVENVEGLVAGHVLLQQPETVRMDRPHECRADLVQRGGAEPFFDARGNARLQLVSGPLGERERDDRGRVGTVGHQLRESLRNHLGLARTSRRDDLHMGAAVQHGRTRVTLKLWCS